MPIRLKQRNFQDTIPAPEPLPVGAARTHTIRFDEPQPTVADTRRRQLIMYALALVLDSTAFVAWLTFALPHHLYREMAMPAFVGLPLGMLLSAVWVVITVIAVNDVWPRGN